MKSEATLTMCFSLCDTLINKNETSKSRVVQPITYKSLLIVYTIGAQTYYSMLLIFVPYCFLYKWKIDVPL